jgi:hypothetical protein
MIYKKIKKSQTYAIDSIIALFIFIVLFLSVSVIWDNSISKIHYNEQRNDIEIVTRNSFNNLFSMKGDPHNWHLTQEDEIELIKSIGVISYNNNLDLDKLEKVMNNEFYNKSKLLMGFLGPNYEYNINISIYDKDMNNKGRIESGYYGNCSENIILNKIKSINSTDFAVIQIKGCITS